MSPGTAPVDVGGREPLSRVHVRTPRPSAAPAPRPVGRGGAAGAAGVGDSGQSRDTLARKAAELRVPRRAQLISGSSRSAAAIAGFFGVFALLIAAVGLYALVAGGVAERTREIGVRLALGSTSGGVLRLVMGDGARLGVVGLGLGLAGALGVARAMGRLLYGLSPGDPVTFAEADHDRRDGFTSGRPLRGPLHQLLEPRVVPQRIEGGIDPEPPGRQIERDAQQRLELIERTVRLTEQDVGADQLELKVAADIHRTAARSRS
jgi:hypothetical protein